MRRLRRFVTYREKFMGKIDDACLKLVTAKSSGIDGLLVTVGLCIIALVLCAFMKDQLGGFIKTIVGELQTKASQILGSTVPVS